MWSINQIIYLQKVSILEFLSWLLIAEPIFVLFEWFNWDLRDFKQCKL